MKELVGVVARHYARGWDTGRVDAVNMRPARWTCVSATTEYALGYVAGYAAAMKETDLSKV